MKKGRKIVAFAMAMTLLCGAFALPAGAVKPVYLYSDPLGTDYLYSVRKDGSICINNVLSPPEILAIPAQIDEKPVSALKQCALLRADTVKQIVLPDTVTEIGDHAFTECTALTEIRLPNRLEKLGQGAFEDCTSLNQINLPNTLTEIQGFTFYGCKGLKKVVLPRRLRIIKEAAFKNCIQLTLNLSANLAEIQLEAFCNVKGITASNPHLTLNKTGIYKDHAKTLLYAFSPKNKRLTVPKSVTRIAPCALSGASELRRLRLPARLTRIERRALTDAGQNYMVKNGTQLTLPKSVKTLERKSFYRTKLQVLRIPKTVRRIETGAFWNASLKAVSIAKGVKRIGRRAFYDCDLVSITIPKCIQIGKQAIGYNSDSAYYTETGLNSPATKNKQLQIVGAVGSSAERYAKRNGFSFVDVHKVKRLLAKNIRWGEAGAGKTGWKAAYQIRNRTRVYRQGKRLKQNRDYILILSRTGKRATLSVVGVGRYTGSFTRTFPVE